MVIRKAFVVVAMCLALAGCSAFWRTPAPRLPPAAGGETTHPAPETAGPTPAATISTPSTPQPTASPSPAPTSSPAPVEINIMAVGDIMFHAPMIAAAKVQSGGYDFDYSFQYVRDILSSADLALGNFECTFGGKPYSVAGGTSFSAPDEAAAALKWAGFDVICTSNNHAYDRGENGFLRTVQIMRGEGLQNIGTRADASEKPYIIMDVKGIKVGMTAYTYGARTAGSRVALNGIGMSARTSSLVNVFQPSDAAQELASMAQVVQEMRSDGADIVLFFLHWGTEDQRTPAKNSVQEKMAQGLADAGVDILFASHPHVLQKVDVITSAKTGRKMFVTYSLGNFISNQRSEYNAKWVYTEDGMIVDVKVAKQPGGGAEAVSMQYLPTWTFMYASGGLRRYTVVPLQHALASPQDFGIQTPRDIRKAQISWDHTQALLKDAVESGVISLMDEGK